MRSLIITTLAIAGLAMSANDASAQYMVRPGYDGVNAVYPNPMASHYPTYGFASPYQSPNSNGGFYTGNRGFVPIYQTVTPGIIYNTQYYNTPFYGRSYGYSSFGNRYRR